MLEFCRIHGLTSAKGKRLNGRGGSTNDGSCGPQEDRVGVWIYGEEKAIAIKRTNLQFFPNAPDVDFVDMGSAVGRKTLRQEQFQALLLDQNPHHKRILARKTVSGPSCRSKGTLVAFQEYIQHDASSTERRPVLLKLVDLNLVIAMNRILSQQQDEEIHLESSQDLILQPICRQLQTKFKNMVLAQYCPHRVDPHSVSAGCTHAVNSTKAGSFHIYPCIGPDYQDALEVRFVGVTDIHQVAFLDYGPEETTQYVRNALALRDEHRLLPTTLATADPPAYWSAVLNSQRVLQVFKEMVPNWQSQQEELVREWDDIYHGYMQSLEQFKRVTSPLRHHTLLPQEGRWQLTSEVQQVNVADSNARIAVLMCMLSSNSQQEEHDQQVPTRKEGPTIQLVEYCRTTQFAIDFERFATSQDPNKWINFAKGQDTSSCCSYCGLSTTEGNTSSNSNTTPMLVCSKCKMAPYCSKDCQRKAWKDHKKICGKLSNDTSNNNANDNDDNGSGIQVKAGTFRPGELPSSMTIMSEVSGTGSWSVVWMGTSSNLPMPHQIIMKRNVHDLGNVMGDESIQFRTLTDLHPVVRLIVTCGPLPMPTIAKACLDEALHCVHGDVSQLRAPYVGFTPLEFASKKGVLEIVQWLLTDERTKDLIHVGSPMGWAAYTNKVNVLRLLHQHGGNGEATDEHLWGACPPLLVAAQNGSVDAMQFLVEECHVNMHVKDRLGRDMVDSVQESPNWKELPGHVAAYEYAKRKLGR